jgi:glyoxylase-like metal-dependent hydrolase (beta-lactamase superfamily II)
MSFKPLRHAYSVRDVELMVRRLYNDEIVFHDGDSRIAPGIELIHVGGHTMGLQAVRVHTARGWVVLASDASHYYDNILNEAPFPVVHDVGDMLLGHRRLMSLGETPSHVVPGHDPLVMRRFPRHGRPADEIVALHLEPTE